MKKVLLVSDLPGAGKAALAGMIPVISTMDVEVNTLPTALVSNNFGYGRAEIFDTTEYMRKTQKIWNELNFRFDIIVTGILMNEEQVDIIEDIINMHEVRPLVIVDPIMGDDGSIYPGLSEDIVKGVRKILPLADIIIPNSTEVSLILEKEYNKITTSEEIEDSINKLLEKGCKEVLITSVKTDEGYFVYGYSNKDKEIFKIPYNHYPVSFGGTGDLFASLTTGKIGEGLDIKDAANYAVSILSKILGEESKRGLDVIMDVPVEKYLKGLDHLLD